jgi:hypothetical protein
MFKVKRQIIVAAAIFVMAVSVQEARACTCAPPPPPAPAFAAADAVFSGKVVSFAFVGDGSARLAKTALSKIWKGERGAASEILTAPHSAACGYDFQVDETYLIYAYRADDGKLYTNICTRTRPVRAAAEDLKYLESVSSYPLAVGNTWTFLHRPTQTRDQEKIIDSLRIAGKLFYRFERWREFSNVLLRLADDGKLLMRLDTTDQVWLDFGAKIGDQWPAISPDKLARWTVELQSKTDTIKVEAGTFVPCYRFHFRFLGADNDWYEWYALNVGPVKRHHYGIAFFEYPLASAILNGKPLPTAVAEEQTGESIRHFAMQQNFPNPFFTTGNNATAIRYRLAATATVKLSVYDMLGREIKTLVQREQPHGEYSVDWDGTNLRGEKAPNGIYFYRLVAGKLAETKKIVLTR